MQPLRKTSPPVKEEMKINSSGAGMSNVSPYISWASMMIGLGTPRVIGWVGFTVQTSSRSCSLRQRSVQVVPISLPKIFDQCPECSTSSPMPESTCWWTRSTTSSATSPCAACPHQTSTSVLASTSSVSPCSGSASVVVLTTTLSPRFSAIPSAMVVCIPCG